MCSSEGQWDVGHVYLFIFASKEVQAWDKISHDRFEMRSLQCWGELISACSQLSPDTAARARPDHGVWWQNEPLSLKSLFSCAIGI